ncbi:MAG: hypothetical protein P4N24_22495 [Acidobacteriota bacterium]|nr:hypothetical protein [Acidobacteriota bacterium]
MPSWSAAELPNLTAQTCVETSPTSTLYNCIAWAAGDPKRWWWPVNRRGISYWPQGVPREETVQAFVLAFSTLGYSPCENPILEEGVEKIAIYAKIAYGQAIPTHAARQLESGEWTSKLGPLEDVRHLTLGAVSGPIYGRPMAFLFRPRIKIHCA